MCECDFFRSVINRSDSIRSSCCLEISSELEFQLFNFLFRESCLAPKIYILNVLCQFYVESSERNSVRLTNC